MDGKFWDYVIVVIGMISYFLVGILFSIGLLKGKNAGKEAFLIIFIALMLLTFYVYKGILKFKQWILSWSLFFKITVPIILVIAIIGIIILMIFINKKRGYYSIFDPID